MDLTTQLIIGAVALLGVLGSFFIKSRKDFKRGEENARNQIEKAEREEKERQRKEFTDSLEDSRNQSDESARGELRGKTIKRDD